MIFVKIFWQDYREKFKLIKELMINRNIECRVAYKKGRTAIKITGTAEEIESADKIISTMMHAGNGCQRYIFQDIGTVDIKKPLIVYDVREVFPKMYHAELLPNYLKEDFESVKIYKGYKPWGFAKFNPQKVEQKDIFVCNNPFHSFMGNISIKEG